MAPFDLIRYYTPLSRWEQREKENWRQSPRQAETLEVDYLRSVTEERIFAGRPGSVVLKKHDRYRRIFEHTHDFFELIYIARGECRNRIESETMNLSAGQFCLIAPGVRHTIGVFSDEGIVMNIILRGSTFAQTFSRLLTGVHPLSGFFLSALSGAVGCSYLLFSPENGEELYSLVNRMAEENLRSDEFSPLILENLTVTLFCMLMREDRERMITSRMRHPAAADAEDILGYIHGMGPTVTLRQTAERFCYTESYLSTRIKSLTGMTFTEIVSLIRIRRAKALLLTTELPVKEIARQCGFPSVEHFCRAFRRETGSTPTGYRSGEER